MATTRNIPTYISLAEAATMLSMSPKTIRRRISDGTIPAYRCGGRHIRIRLEDVESVMRRVPSVGW